MARDDLRIKAYRLLAANEAMYQASRQHRARIRLAADEMVSGLQDRAQKAGRLYLDPAAAWRYVKDRERAGVALHLLTE